MVEYFSVCSMQRAIYIESQDKGRLHVKCPFDVRFYWYLLSESDIVFFGSFCMTHSCITLNMVILIFITYMTIIINQYIVEHEFLKAEVKKKYFNLPIF